jgi:hypothetical protein
VTPWVKPWVTMCSLWARWWVARPQPEEQATAAGSVTGAVAAEGWAAAGWEAADDNDNDNTLSISALEFKLHSHDLRAYVDLRAFYK